MSTNLILSHFNILKDTGAALIGGDAVERCMAIPTSGSGAGSLTLFRIFSHACSLPVCQVDERVVMIDIDD